MAAYNNHQSNSFYLQNLFGQPFNQEYNFLKYRGHAWFNLNNKSTFLAFCEEILHIFFKFTDFNKFEDLVYNYTSFWELIHITLAYDPNASFRENFLLFVFEIFMNFLNLYFFIQRLPEKSRAILKDYFTNGLDSIKGFLLKISAHADDLIERMILGSVQTETINGFVMETYNFVKIDSYKEFSSKSSENNNLTSSYKLRVIEKLNYCAEDLCYKHKHVQSQLIYQVLHSYRNLIIIYDKMNKNLIATNHYMNKTEGDVLRPSSCNRKESYYRIFSNNPSIVDDASRVDALDQSFSSPKDPLSSNNMVCSICKVKVSGFARFCVKCFHGGHEDHVIEWFKMHKSCPECISCECVTYNEKKDMLSASAIINPYIA